MNPPVGEVSRQGAGLGHRFCRTAAEPISPATLVAVVGAVLLACSSAIHLHLWSDGYRSIPTIGPLFLVQGIVGIALAVGVVVLRRPCALAVGALFALGTMGGLLLSVNVGLFGFRDSLRAPWAVESLVLEAAAAGALAVAAAMVARSGRP